MSEYRKPDNFIPVISNSGASGKFISTILTYSANNIDFPFDPRKTTADYHTEACYFMDRHTNLGWTGQPTSMDFWNNILFKNNSPFRTMSFAGGSLSMHLQFKKFLNDFPNGKIVYITVTNDDILTIDLNHAWKLDLRLYMNQDQIKELDSKEEKSFDWRKEYSIDKVTQIVKDRLALDYGFPEHYSNTSHRFIRKWHSTLPDNLKKRIFLINFSDIVGNPELVIETLEQVSGNVFTQNLLNAYAQYVNIQLDHYKEHIPWHPALKQGQ